MSVIDIISFERKALQIIYDLLPMVNDFDKYIEILNNIKEDVCIVIAIKDTVTGAMLKNAKPFVSLGISSSFENTHHRAFVGIINCGTVLIEKLGEIEKDAVKFSNDNIFVLSKTFKFGNTAIIRINEKDYSLAKRGFNIVVYDTIGKKLVDSVTFDYFGESCQTKRKNTINALPVAIKTITSAENTKRLIIDIKDKCSSNFYREYETHLGVHTNQAKEIFFAALKTEGLKRLNQLVLLYILSRFDALCRYINIDYCVGWGAALGMYRHKGFIPWDDDLDIFILSQDGLKIQRFLHNPTEEFSDCSITIERTPLEFGKFKFIVGNTGFLVSLFDGAFVDSDKVSVMRQLDSIRNTTRDICRVELGEERKNHLDNEKAKIWAIHAKEMLDIVSNNLNRNRKKDYIIMRVFSMTRYIVPTEFMLPPKRMTFEGIELNFPNNLSDFLKFRYGDVWKLPLDIYSHEHIKLKKNSVLIQINYIKIKDPTFFKTHIEQDLNRYLSSEGDKIVK